ncbi:hypothetical protein [Microbacterium sp.]|uniref:hypothetical protein n=1 Tax=Microbacterium sp. TaxID=51671 RepID=UPI0039E43369
MAESQSEPRVRRGWRMWTAVVAIAVLLAGGIVWGVLAGAGSGRSGEESSPESSSTPTPQPTEFATPSPGATDEVEKPADGEEVPLDQPAPAVQGVVAEVVGLEATTAGGDVPGEPAGPAIKVTVRLTNGSASAVDTAGSNVTLTYGGDDRLPAAGLAVDGTSTWPDSIPTGGHADAIFQFAVPSVPEGDIRVMVDLLASAPNIVFVGSRP